MIVENVINVPQQLWEFINYNNIDENEQDSTRNKLNEEIAINDRIEIDKAINKNNQIELDNTIEVDAIMFYLTLGNFILGVIQNEMSNNHTNEMSNNNDSNGNERKNIFTTFVGYWAWNNFYSHF